MPDYYELRRYQLQNGPQGKALDDFLREVAIPALNAHGVRPVGVFVGLLGDVNPAVYTLLRHTSLEAIVAVRAWLAADPDFQRAGGKASPPVPKQFGGRKGFLPPHRGCFLL